MTMINGIYAATLSILDADLGLDIRKTIAHAEKVIDKGCHGVVFFGSTGQSQLISLSDKINLINNLSSNSYKENFIIGTGIKQFATQDNAGVVDDNGNTVELIDLTRGEATIFDFRNVASKLSDVRLEAEYGVGGRSNLPIISILDADSKKLLIQLRSKVENKIGKDGPYLYYRNYIEKGPFLTELIGRSANENPVTSS